MSLTGGNGFHIADYVVFGISMLISLGIGLYHAFAGGRQRTTSEYLMGDRKLKIFPTALSLLVTFQSSIMMLGYPAEIYVYGIMFWLTAFGFVITSIISTAIFIPLFHPLNMTSVYEYLELRYRSRVVRKIGTILGMIYNIWYMGIVLYGPGIALGAVTGFPFWTSTIVVAGASVCYTCLGGIKAVIWTDVFQCFIMFVGMFAIIIKSTIDVGGVSEVYSISLDNNRLNLFDFNPDPTVRLSFWSVSIGSIIGSLWFPFNQATTQRICGTPTVKSARTVMLIATVGNFLMATLAAAQGLVAFAYYYKKGCDPLESGAISNPNQIVPYLVMDLFKGAPGMPGLYLASIFSACLSTISSILSSLAAVTWDDFVKPLFKDISEYRATVIAKLSVVFFGLVGVGIAFLISSIGGTLMQITGSLSEAMNGALLGLFLLGIVFPWANWKGAIVGTVLAYALVCWIGIGSNFYPNRVTTPWLPPAPTNQCAVANETNYIEWMNGTSPLPDLTTATTIAVNVSLPAPNGIAKLYSLSFMWIPTVGIMSTIIIGLLVSVITGYSKSSDVDPRHVVPIFDYCLCLPEKVKKFCWCSLNRDKKIETYENGTSEMLLNGRDAVPMTKHATIEAQFEHKLLTSEI